MAGVGLRAVPADAESDRANAPDPFTGVSQRRLRRLAGYREGPPRQNETTPTDLGD